MILKKDKRKNTLFWLEKIQLLTLFGFLLESRMFHETLAKVVLLPPIHCVTGDFLFEHLGYLLITILIGGIVSIWISVISFRNNTLSSKSKFILFSPVFQFIIIIFISFLSRYSGLGHELFYGNEIYEYIYSSIPKIATYLPHNLFIINYL